jgi:hypothetical protein
LKVGVCRHEMEGLAGIKGLDRGFLGVVGMRIVGGLKCLDRG